MEAANEVNRLVCGFLDELEGAGQRLMPQASRPAA
jgi:hypothetical protein